MSIQIPVSIWPELERLAGGGTLREQCIIEAVYASAGSSASSELAARLERLADRSSVAASWLARLRRSSGGAGGWPTDAACPVRTRALLVWDDIAKAHTTVGASAAWGLWRESGQPGFAALRTEQQLANGSPMVLSALRCGLELSGAVGAWHDHDRFAAELGAFGLEGWARAAVELTRLRAALRRGRYDQTHEATGRALDDAQRAGHLDLCLAFAALELEILTAAGTYHVPEIDQLSAPAQLRLAALEQAWTIARQAHEHLAEPDPNRREQGLPRSELDGWWAFAVNAASKAGLSTPPAPDTSELNTLLTREHHWRHDDFPDVAGGCELSSRFEDFILEHRYTSLEELLQAQLAWSQLRVDLYGRRTVLELEQLDPIERSLAQEQGLDELREQLQTLEECEANAAENGFDELEVRAVDQQVVLLERLEDSAAADAAARRGAEHVLALLRANIAGSGRRPTIERGLLESLLPVLDRTIEVRVRRALEDAESSRWTAHARAIFALAEQSTGLAVDEVRRVHTGQSRETRPHRFAWAPPDPRFETLIDTLQASLRPSEMVLQYFVSAQFILVFAIFAKAVTWDLIGREDQHQTCSRRWQDFHEINQVVATKPQSIELIPKRILHAIRDGDVDHILVVPHAQIWDLPFASAFSRRGLCPRTALSFHPSATEALRVLHERRDRRRLGRQAVRRMLVGPALDARVERELRTPLSDERFIVDSTAGPATIDALAESDVAAVVCHGTAPRGSSDLGSLQLAEELETPITALADAALQRCRLIMLHSCWGGRLEATRREDPVLGVPQVLLDAGVGTVLAARAKLPQELIPYMQDLLEVAIRFEPVERALARCVGYLDRHWDSLLAVDPALVESLGPSCRSPFELEYRCYGLPGRHATDRSILSRLHARLTWWRWQRRPERWLERHRGDQRGS